MFNEFKALFDFLKRVFFLFFMPQKLVDLALRHQPNSDKSAVQNSVTKVRKSIRRGLRIVLITGAITFITYFLLRIFRIELSHNMIILMRTIGYLAVLWGVLSPSGWGIQTFGGESLAEIFDEEWHRFNYIMGLFMVLLSYLFELHF